ncbi:MAG TPA: AAA family ATPase [Rhizomicrobium sp.]|nr:AAA family ATPase [Rhizomicrobium sp.]
MSPIVHVVDATSVIPQSINWLWPGWLAKGKLHLLAGAAGTGKTTIAINWAAVITSGRTFPDDHQASAGGRVLIWSGEDDYQDSIVPRFLANGGDNQYLHLVGGVSSEPGGNTRPFDPARDLADLIAAVSNQRFDLLIIDPIISMVSGDSHKNAEVRRSLQPLVDFATRTGMAVLGISHFSKGSAGRDPVERVTGSLAFGALPRLVMGTVKPTEAGAKRRLVRAKSNIGPDGDGFEFEVVQTCAVAATGLEGQAIRWGAALHGAAKELFEDVQNENADFEQPARSEARSWLKSILGTGPVEVSTLERMAAAKGLAWRTVRRAKDDLSVEALKRGSTWLWIMPIGDGEIDDQAADVGQVGQGGQVGQVGQPAHLQKLNGSRNADPREAEPDWDPWDRN